MTTDQLMSLKKGDILIHNRSKRWFEFVRFIPEDSKPEKVCIRPQIDGKDQEYTLKSFRYIFRHISSRTRRYVG